MGFPTRETNGDTLVKKRIISGSLRVLIPLYTTYIIFLASVFLLFIPHQKHQLLDQKKESIRHLTESAVSLLDQYEKRIQNGKISPEQARRDAKEQIRHLRYGPEGKDYFWINDYHPFMIMHPYRPELEGRDLTLFQDAVGNHPFMAMVETVMGGESGYVNYFWQWKDTPGESKPKISYVRGFAPWKWIIGTGVYENEILEEIGRITRQFYRIFTGIFIFIILLSLYITVQVIRIEKKKIAAQKARALEELRLKKLLELSRLSGESTATITEFALEEAIQLTRSRLGFLAFMNAEESQLTMHTWSEQAMDQCRIKDKTLVYDLADTGLWAEAARVRKPVVINDYKTYTGPGKKGYPKGHVRINRVLNVPVFDGERIVALAGVGNKGTPYDESDIRQLQLMMDGMWKILEKSRGDKQLRESEERYRLLADNATDGIWILDLATMHFTYTSPAMAHLYGYAPEEFTDMKMGSHMTGDSIEKASKAISEEIARDGQPGVDPDRHRILELEMVRPGGELLWVEIKARILRDPQGKPDRVLGITRDITRRKALENELRQANTDLCLAQKIAGIGNWSKDPATGRRTWSQEIYRLFERDRATGPCPFETLKPLFENHDWHLFNTALQKAGEIGTPFDMELKLSLPSGNEKWIQAICDPEPCDTGYFLRGTIQDITERKHLEVRVQQTQKMEALGTLAGGIAHDFNNILSSIIGFTELAKRRLDKDSDIHHKLDNVLAGGLRARDLVRHILIFSRKADVRKTNTRIAPLIKECLKFLRASLGPEIDIRHHIQYEEALITADPTQMHQVLMNLFTNAAHAMKDGGGILTVELASMAVSRDDRPMVEEIAPGPYVQIRITDTGTGISKEAMDKIFEPFFTTKARGEGTGMGLSLVYGIVREMSGTILVESTPGRGTRFDLLIPDQAGQGEDLLEPARAQIIRGKGKILLVDDEAPIIEWVTQTLLKLGYGVEAFDNGAAALERFKQDPTGFDLVLTDLSMPGMTGLNLARLILAQRPGMPVILCTGFSEDLTRDRIRDLGLTDMVMKPMIAGELSQVVGRALTQNKDIPRP